MASPDRDKGDPRGDQQTERHQASRRYPVLRRGLVGHRSMLACRARPGSNLRVSLAKTRVPNFPDSRENTPLTAENCPVGTENTRYINPLNRFCKGRPQRIGSRIRLASAI